MHVSACMIYITRLHIFVHIKTRLQIVPLTSYTGGAGDSKIRIQNSSMKLSLTTSVLAVILLHLKYTSEANLQQYDGWNQKVMYKGTANLTCANEYFDPLGQQNAYYQWILPSGRVIGNVTSQSFSDRYTFVHDGSTLLIRDIEKSDFGFYLCLVTLGSQPSVFTVIKLGVNIEGPYFGDLWEKYLPNLRTGLVASGVTFVVMSMFCYNLMQFQNRHDKPCKTQPSAITDFSERSCSSAGSTIKSYSNPAFVASADERISENHKQEVAAAVDVQSNTLL